MILKCNQAGCVPSWLEGSLYRNGPGKYRFGPDEMHHLFDGMAVLHHYVIKDTKVQYHNRLLDSDTYRRNKAANRIVVTEFGTIGHPDPCKSLFTRYFTYFAESVHFTDNDCVNFMQLGDQIYAITETPVMNIINPDTLATMRQVDWQEKYIAVHLSTAHPLRDRDGTTYNLATTIAPQCLYNIVQIPPTEPGDANPMETAKLVGSIPSQWSHMPNYFHSFSLTENYIVFVEQPMGFNFLDIAANRITGKPFLDALHYYEGYKTKLHVVHKYTGALLPAKFVAKAFFVFHHINAYEDDGQIVVDVCAYDDGSIVGYMTLENMRNPSGPAPMSTFRRFVLPLAAPPPAGKRNLVSLDYTTATAVRLDDGAIFCVPECIPEAVIELSQINYKKYNGRKYRYTYGISTDHKLNNRLIKVDVEEKCCYFWALDDYFPGEPVFVEAPDAENEDDGVLLSPVISLKDDLLSFLLILDAKSFTELGRAEIPSGISVPISFHGFFNGNQEKELLTK